MRLAQEAHLDFHWTKVKRNASLLFYYPEFLLLHKGWVIHYVSTIKILRWFGAGNINVFIQAADQPHAPFNPCMSKLLFYTISQSRNICSHQVLCGHKSFQSSANATVLAKDESPNPFFHVFCGFDAVPDTDTCAQYLPCTELLHVCPGIQKRSI